VVEVQRQAVLALLGVLRGRSLSTVLSLLARRRPALSPADRGAIQDLCYGTCRWLGTLREILRLMRAALPDPEVEALLLVALYQLEWTRAPEHAVVDGAVRTCARLGKTSAKGLVNALLRRFQRERAGLLERAHRTPLGRFSYPQWWIDEIERAYPNRFEAVLDAGNQHPPMTLRVNRRKVSVDGYLEELRAASLRGERVGPAAVLLDHPLPVERLPGFSEGRVSVQDLAAQRAAALLDLADGMRVLDACAAPGGKTGHILETAHVELTALDQDAQRLRRVHENLSRLGLEARLLAADAGELAAWWDGCPFDRILLDAPCSASGIVRRHPDIKWLRHAQDLPRLAHVQSRLLAALWRTLAPGGTLLYATCSLFPLENQARIADFLGVHQNARRVPITELAQTDGQLLPDSRQDGFFYALLHKLDAHRAEARAC
jgi:16S rRNA (cytosine967-C5)-methyltransferase